MKKYCYSKDIRFTRENLLKEMDLSIFFQSNQQDPDYFKKLLKTFGIYLETLDDMDSVITVRMLPIEKDCMILPNISNRYYDQDDYLTSTFSIQPENSTLLSLEGEIFEKLDFNLETAYEFCKEHHYDEFIYPETTSCIHFKGVELNRWRKEDYDEMLHHIKKPFTDKEMKIVTTAYEKVKDIKEIYITKDAQKFGFYYNAPHIFNTRSSDASLSVEEIGIIQTRILELLLLNGQKNMRVDFNVTSDTQNDNEEFLKYVYAYLMQYRKIVENKGYRDIVPEVLDKTSLDVIKSCIEDKYPNGIYCKITIISNHPIQTTEDKNKEFIKKIMM